MPALVLTPDNRIIVNGTTLPAWVAATITRRATSPDSDAAIEALRHLFWIMERLDKQAGPPFSHDHMVKITAEAWLDLVRPAIEQVRARLTEQEDRPGFSHDALTLDRIPVRAARLTEQGSRTDV